MVVLVATFQLDTFKRTTGSSRRIERTRFKSKKAWYFFGKCTVWDARRSASHGIWAIYPQFPSGRNLLISWQCPSDRPFSPVYFYWLSRKVARFLFGSSGFYNSTTTTIISWLKIVVRLRQVRTNTVFLFSFNVFVFSRPWPCLNRLIKITNDV